MKERSNSNIISFSQDASFYLKLGDKRIDKGDLIGAYAAYRDALELDPQNPDACIAAAEVLYQLRDFEGSNRLLMVQNTMYGPITESFFGLACNFYGLSEFDYATESLETYLKIDPKGSYAYDAVDFLALLEDDDELADALYLEDDEDFDTLTICSRAQHLLNCGKPEIAEELLKTHLNERNNAWRARDMLVAAQLSAGKLEEANRNAAIVKKVSEELGDPTVGMQNRVLLAIRENRSEEALQELERTGINDADSPDFLIGAAGLYITLKQFGKATEILESVYRGDTFDKKSLYLLAHCYLMTGKNDAAAEMYDAILKLEPHDLVAKFYSAYARSKESEPERTRFFLPTQLPVLETLLNMKRFADYCSMSPEGLQAEWEKGDDLKSLILWVMTMPDDRIRRTALAILSEIGGAGPEYILRDFLLRSDQTDELKRDALGCLKRMGAKEPYAAYIESQWMQGNVTMVRVPERMPEEYREVLQLLDQKVRKDDSKEMLCMRAVDVFMEYLVRQGVDRLPVLRKDSISTYTAALEYAASVLTSTAHSKEEIAERYGTTVRRIMNAVKKMGLLPSED